MLALIAAGLLLLNSFGVDFDGVNIFILALAFWAAHFAFGIALPWRRGGGTA